MGNSQVEGIDCGETFAPTGKPSSLRLLVAVASINGWEIHQMDAVTAFLNGNLEDETYVEQPNGYVRTGDEGKVWQLKKSLYGLKQSPKIWQDDIKNFLISIGFNQCEVNHCTYIRSNPEDGLFTAVYVHVDDLAIMGNDILKFKTEISSNWEMDNLAIASTVVGIEIKRANKFKYNMNQQRFTETILAQFKVTNIKPASTPLPPGQKLLHATNEEVEKFRKSNLPYQSAVGSIMYLAQCTRPDLCHAVGLLSQHLERPLFMHWESVLHVFRYLANSKDLGLSFDGNQSKSVEGNESFHLPISHVDADWAGDKNSRRLTTGYVFTLAGGAISWRSRLQPTVALSSTEAKYWAVTEAGQELMWLRTMMLKFRFEDANPTVLFSDNQGAIHLTSKSIFHSRTKHIEVKYHWIREVVEKKELALEYCPSELMVADLLTKPLEKGKFIKLRN